jgi:hypothetical protein
MKAVFFNNLYEAVTVGLIEILQEGLRDPQELLVLEAEEFRKNLALQRRFD